MIYLFIHLFISQASQHVWGYFRPNGWRIAFIVNLYLHFCVQLLLSNFLQLSDMKYSHEIQIIKLFLVMRVYANGPGDRGSIPGRIIPKTQKMVLDAALLYTQHYKVRIKIKGEQSMERSCALPNTSV